MNWNNSASGVLQSKLPFSSLVYPSSEVIAEYTNFAMAVTLAAPLGSGDGCPSTAHRSAHWYVRNAVD